MQIGEVIFMAYIVPTGDSAVKPRVLLSDDKTAFFAADFNHVSINQREFAENSRSGPDL